MSALVLFALSIAFGLLFQKLIRSVSLASVAAASTSAIAFHAIGYLVEGGLDSLVMVSFVIALVFAFLVALSIGSIMTRAGTKAHRDDRSG